METHEFHNAAQRKPKGIILPNYQNLTARSQVKVSINGAVASCTGISRIEMIILPIYLY